MDVDVMPLPCFITYDQLIAFTKTEAFREVIEQRPFNGEACVGNAVGGYKEDWHE
jgi:hypothetical protein